MTSYTTTESTLKHLEKQKTLPYSQKKKKPPDAPKIFSMGASTFLLIQRSSREVRRFLHTLWEVCSVHQSLVNFVCCQGLYSEMRHVILLLAEYHIPWICGLTNYQNGFSCRKPLVYILLICNYGMYRIFSIY